MIANPLTRPICSPIASKLTDAPLVSGAAPITLESLLAEAGAADWDISDSDSLFQLSDGTTAVANGDPIGYIADQTGHGLHLVQATAGHRYTLSSRTGVPMIQSDCVDDTYTLPVGIASTTGTFAFASLLGAPQCFTMDADTTYAVPQFSRACWFPRILTADERTAVLAGLGAIFDTTHDVEVVGTSLTAHAAYSWDKVIDDPADTGAVMHFDFQTSADSAAMPPWDLYDSYHESTGLTDREWADVVTTIEDITILEIGRTDPTTSDHISQVQDIARYPAMKGYSRRPVMYEGSVPDPSTWPENIGLVIFSGDAAPIGKLAGRIGSLAPCAALEYFTCHFHNITGAVPYMGPALISFDMRNCRLSSLPPGWTAPSTMKYFHLYANFLSTADVDAIFAAFRAAAVTDCNIHLDGANMGVPSAQGIADAQWLFDNGANSPHFNT